MTTKPSVPFPLLLLDMLGSLLLLWGLLEQLAWVQWLPASWQVPFYPLVLMGMGLLLVTPYQLALVLAFLRQTPLTRSPSGQAAAEISRGH